MSLDIIRLVLSDAELHEYVSRITLDNSNQDNVVLLYSIFFFYAHSLITIICISKIV